MDESKEVSDKVEQSKNLEKSSELTAKDGVVGDEDQQTVHAHAKQSDNQLSVSEIEMASPKPGESLEQYEKRVAKTQANRFEISIFEEEHDVSKKESLTTGQIKAIGGDNARMMFESVEQMQDGPGKEKAKESIKQAYGQLLADASETFIDNDWSRRPMREFKSDFGELQLESNSESFGQILETEKSHFSLGDVLKPVLEVSRKTFDAAIEAGSSSVGMIMHPYRGKIDATMQHIPESAWHSAYSKFPQFKNAGIKEQNAVEIIKAIIRSELFNCDKLEDQSSNQEGFIKPEEAPLYVAATLAKNIELYQRNNIPITEKTLAYSFKPPDGKILPKSLEVEQVRSVMRHLDIVRCHVIPKPEER